MRLAYLGEGGLVACSVFRGCRPIDRLSQQVVGGLDQIGDLGDELRDSTSVSGSASARRGAPSRVVALPWSRRAWPNSCGTSVAKAGCL
jgi:hypothetical protein